jgi:hypothetical protein
MTDHELDEIRLRCAAASPGPWKAWVEGRDHTSGSSFVQTAAEDIEMSGATTADYDFIANARQDVPRLLAEVERLRALVGRV